MEKTINIDGRPVTFKASGGLAYRYKAQFGREFFADVDELSTFLDTGKVEKKAVKDKKGKPVFVNGQIQFEEKTVYDYTKLALDGLYNILWTMAKTADASIPDPLAWLDSFDTFPVMDILPEVKEILQQNFKTSPKNA